MTDERTDHIEYADTFIGECIAGECGRVATVRVHEDYVLCALHNLFREIGEDDSEAGLALELIRGWHSIAEMHNNGYLLRLTEYARGELLERERKAERWEAQLERAEYESDNSVQARLRRPSSEKAAE